MAKTRLTAKIDFRLPEDVAQKWKRAARDLDLSMADWLRQQIQVDGVDPVIINKPTPQRRYTKKILDDPLSREIARVGNNLNQVARWANTYKTNAEAAQVISYLKNISDLVEGLRDDDD